MSQSQNFDTNYSFKTGDANSQTFYFTLDAQNHQPIKLGDGTFGVVFAVYDSNGEDRFAVKLLYGHSDTDIVKSRFDNEINSTQLITQIKRDTNLVGVIRTVGWTREFQKSQVYKKLENFFAPFRISNYALVTEKYDATLKDLLEGGIKKYTIQQSATTSKIFLPEPLESRQEVEDVIDKIVSVDANKQALDANKQALKEKIYELTGYDILRQMNFEDRIADILPYLVDIAEGLVTLHKAKLLHLDLKPANIFVRKPGVFVEAVIGDLGFLLPGEKPTPAALPGANAELPLGTRHYRSPEQKDFFDICDVEVQVDTNDVKLIAYDPKLRDTIIEDTDVVVFSNNNTEIYNIKSIVIDEQSENSSITITLKLNSKAKENFRPDKKTQIILYKRQDERTDLFGFGAILFDLLTCGESPERFYDNIRMYDKKDKKVDEIMEDYLMVSNFQSSEPSLVQVFEPFKLHKSSTIYAPAEIVEIILKCMLYKAENTFYSLSRYSDGSANKSVNLVLDRLMELHESQRFGFRKAKNHLCDRTWKSGNSSTTPSFLETLKELQTLDKNNLHNRFVKGFWYLDQISDLVSRSLNSPSFSFSELHPTNLAVIERNGEPNALNIRFQVYKMRDSYEKDLRGDFVYTKINRDIGNPFVPNYLAFVRRKIVLQNIAISSNAIGNTQFYKCSYQFLDSSLYKDNIKKGDWIIIKSKNNTKNVLLQVESSVGSNLTLKSDFFEPNNDVRELESPNFEDMTQISSSEGVYYKDIDPCVYYLNMLGIYVYNIFFAGIEDNTYNKPIITDIINNILSINDSIKIKILDQCNNHKQSGYFDLFNKKSPKFVKQSEFVEIIHALASMYLKLTLHESENSYYRSHEGDSKFDRYRIISLLGDLEILKGKIANFINDKNTNHVALRSYPDDKLLDELPKLSDLIGDSSQIKVPLQFDKLTSSLVEVDSGGARLRLAEMLS